MHMENEILQQILNELKGISQKVSNLETEVTDIKSEVKDLKPEIKDIKQDQTNLENKVGRGLIQQKENADFIKAIKHAAEENNTKLEGVSLTLAKIEGNTTAIAKKLNTLETVTADNWGEINRLKAVK